jgi:hypothetical protein
LFYRGIGQHPRVAQRDQNGTLGGLDKARREGKRTKLERASAAGTKRRAWHGEIVRETAQGERAKPFQKLLSQDGKRLKS